MDNRSLAALLLSIFILLGAYGCGLIKLLFENPIPEQVSTAVVGYSDNQRQDVELAKLNGAALRQYAREKPFYKRPREVPHRCLALSGGGVRSAMFSIGVMKALHDRKFLQEVDIISGVSGGAYAAAWYVVQQFNNKGMAPTNDAEWTRHVKTLASQADAIRNYTLKTPELLVFSVIANSVRQTLADIGGVSWPSLRKNNIGGLYRAALLHTYFYDDEQSSEIKKGSNLSLKQLENFLLERGPLFIINTTYATSSSLLRNKVFEITPISKGSNALGYHSVTRDQSLDNLETLIEAVALSGAALDAEAYSGPTRWVLKALSVGLGGYINWQTPPESEESIFLSDGGHSENLGVYSLARRLCEDITIVDGEFDPTYDFESYVLLKCALKREMAVDLEVKHIDEILPTFNFENLGTCRDLIDKRKYWRQGVFNASKPIMKGSIGKFPLLNESGEIESKKIEVKYIKLSIDDSRLKSSEHPAWYSDEVVSEYTKAQLKLKTKWFVPKRWLRSQAYFPQRTTMDQIYPPELANAYISLGSSTVDRYWDSVD